VEILHQIDLLPVPTEKSTQQARGKYFIDAQGTRLPSVTTILNATRPLAAREALARWRERVGPAEASQISTSASRRGTQTHRHLKNYLLGKTSCCPESVQPYWESLQPVLSGIQEVQLVESTVFHYDLGYAGKVDCVATYQNIPCILDWKTSDRPKGSVDRLYDGPIQLAAYCGAVNHFYSEYGVKLSHALLSIAIPGEPAETFLFGPDVLRHYWEQWQERVYQFYRGSS
jgi:hypothetical protein